LASNDWKVSAKSVKLKKPTYSVCCYPCEDGYIKGQEFLIRSAIVEAELKMAKGEHVRVLFSAHGLPKKIIKGGDPYQWQIEQTAMAVANALKKSLSRPNLDWSVCYQSRVGPLEWIDPSLDQELIRAGQDDKGVVVVPIAFVSEHSETLVELDIEYREKAVELNIPVYVRVPALSIEENFINSLAKIVEASVNSSDVIRCQAGERQCPAKFTNCPL
jgi:ferrochelatase